MRVLLINPQTSWKGENGFQVLASRNFNDHLGIRYVASNLEQGGHCVDLIDAHFEELPFDKIFEIIKSSDYDLYGISFVEPIVEETITIVKYIKKHKLNSKIFIGGYGATLLGERVLTNCRDIDAAIVGEGEETTLKLVNVINNKEVWHNIRGLMFMDNNNLIKTDLRSLINDIDLIPWPKRGKEYKYGRANILASRGCYGSCTYCSITEFYRSCAGPRVRVRTPHKLVDEMEAVAKTFGVHHFDFVDDNFICTCRNDKEWAVEFVNDLKKRNLKITWGIQARANDVNEELFSILYHGGLRIVSIGIENDVLRVIKLLRTGTTKEIHRRAISILRKLRIDMYIEMILLEPTTTLEEIRENLDFLTEINFTEMYRQNPITFTTKLHLYNGTPVVSHMKALAQVWETGYHLNYKFNDDKVAILNGLLMRWQENTSELAAFQLSYLQYEAVRCGLLGLALKIINLSKRYLKFDLHFYQRTIDFINENPDFNQNQLESFLKNFDAERHFLMSEFSKARDKVLLKK